MGMQTSSRKTNFENLEISESIPVEGICYKKYAHVDHVDSRQYSNRAAKTEDTYIMN